MLFAHKQTREQNDRDRDHFCDHRNILQNGAHLDTKAVIRRQGDNEHDCDELDLHAGQIHKVIQSGRKRDCQRRNRAGTADKPACESKGITDCRVISFVHVNNHAARFWIASPQLRETKSAEQ